MNTPTIELNLTNGGSNVDATTSEDSELSWVLYSSTVAKDLFGDKNYFIQYIEDEETKNEYRRVCDTVLDKNSNEETAENLTVLRALSISLSDKQSLFDVFAGTYIRSEVRKIITRDPETADLVPAPTDEGTQTFAENTRTGIQMSTPTKMSEDVTYYIFAAARHVKGDIYAFKARSGVQLKDTLPPELQGEPYQFVDPLMKDVKQPEKGYYITATEAAADNQYSGQYVYRGSFTISFTEEIYQLKKSASSESELTKVTEENFEDLIQYAGLTIKTVSVDEGTITFEYEDASIGAYIVLFKAGSVCDKAENISTQGARLELKFDTGLGLLDKFSVPEFKVEWRKTGK